MAETERKNRGLLLTSFDAPLQLVDLPMPKATSGSAVIQVLSTLVLPYMNKIHKGGMRHANLHLPLVPNATSVGRVMEVGPDATLVKPGDIVWVDSSIAGRDDPSVHIVQGHLGGEGPRGRILMQGEWRDGAFQKYQKVTLEGLHVLDTGRLSQLGYSIHEMSQIILYTVAAGGIIEVAGVKAGDVVVIGPATGSFGGAAVELALLSGASVILLGRREETMLELKEKLGNPTQLQHLVMTGNDETDTANILRLTPKGKGADIYNDWTSGYLEKSPFFSAAIRAMKTHGKVVLSGAPNGNVEIPYSYSIHKNLQYHARWVSTRETIERVVTMIHQGVLKLGTSGGAEFKTFPSLEQHQEAKDYAEQNGRFKSFTMLLPNGPISDL